ncbi:bacterioferritin-associated ferredoxin [Dasania marina]|uniref:bacterioferritin-associated ferredoxin n=1 Tax=Dasania marina TaxID=471499 RepID=UPI000373ADEC|nr:bacterioferritin-associated ferredoxin [Dasania marina]
MYICLCKSVTDSQIREAVANGGKSFGQVRKQLNLASQCGKCGMIAREIFNESLQHHVENEQLFYAVS